MIAVFFTKTHTRIVNPALAELDPQLPDRIAPTTRSAAPGASSNTRSTSRIKQAAIAA